MEQSVRDFVNGTFVSSLLPSFSIELPAPFIYLGATTQLLDEAGLVERHHLVAAQKGGAIGRLLIFHFESFLPHSDETFNYQIPAPPHDAGPNFRFSPTKRLVQGFEFIHNTWFFDAQANVRRNPQRELAQTAQLLEKHDYRLPTDIQMSRYVSVVDATRKSEFIFFYIEPLEKTGYRAADFVVGGRGELLFDAFSADLTARSDSLFNKLVMQSVE